MLSCLTTITFLLLHSSNAEDFTDYHGCLFSLNDTNGIASTYNLSRFHLTNEAYFVYQNNYAETERTYLFNICGAIPFSTWFNNDYVPSYCRNGSLPNKDLGTCVEWYSNGTCQTVYNTRGLNISASAIQLTHDPHCHWSGTQLNGKFNLSQDYSVSLYDNGNSASGIKYTILNGDYCDKYKHDGTVFRNREFNIELICPDSNRNYFNPSFESNNIINSLVIQYPTCIYTISYETALACPNECISSVRETVHEEEEEGNGEEASVTIEEEAYSVCNTRGICASDPNAGYSRCICDNGWGGRLCDEYYGKNEVRYVTNNNGTVKALVVVAIVVLVIMLVLALYLCHRIRLRQMQTKSHYHQFKQSMLQSHDDDINGDTKVNRNNDNNNDNNNNNNNNNDNNDAGFTQEQRE